MGHVLRRTTRGLRSREAGARTGAAALTAVVLAFAGACRADIPSGRYACDVSAQCPPGFVCVARLCYDPAAAPDAGGEADLGPRDLGDVDMAPPDLGAEDLGSMDAGDGDLGAEDLGPGDAGDGDLGPPDLGMRLDMGPEDSGPPDAGCRTATMEVSVEADTTLASSECRGANHQGSSPLTHTGIGRPLYRFALPGEVQTAFGAGQVRSLALVLTRFDDTSPSGPCSGRPCPAVAGTLVAHPVRNDWDEGSDGSTSFRGYAGADWCRRTGRTLAYPEGESWGMNGANAEGTDVLAAAGSTRVDDTQPTATIPLDPSRWGGLSFLGDVLSVQVRGRRDDDGGGAIFLAWSREGRLSAAARLRVTYCLP
jgi:hypothetical protein